MKSSAVFLSALLFLVLNAVGAQGHSDGSTALRGGARALQGETCLNGLPGYQGIDGACCPLGCGQCGGDGCGAVPGYTGRECCAIGVITNQPKCSESNEAPCYIPELSGTCSNGVPGIEHGNTNGDACCHIDCGVCGGENCGNFPGGSENCCINIIIAKKEDCAVSGEAPCYMTEDHSTPVDPTPKTPAPVEAPAPTPAPVAEPTPSPTAEPTPEPVDPIPEPTPEPTMAPTTAKPVAEPTPAPVSTEKPAATTMEPTSPSMETPAPVGDGMVMYEYVGCFEDRKDDRILEDQLDSDLMTTELCYKHCADKGAAFMATQFSYECFCSEHWDLDYERHGETECDMTCMGDESEICGGHDAFSLYKLLPPMTECSGTPVPAYEQCGGDLWEGSTCCEDGLECMAMGGETCYWQCRPM